MGLGDKKKELYEMMPKGTFTTYEEFDSYVSTPEKLREVYDFIPDGYFKDASEYEVYFSDALKKKEPTGDVSGVGTEPTSPSKSPSTSTKPIDFQAMVAGVKPPTSQVDIELQQTSRVPTKIEPNLGFTPPVEEEVAVEEFAQQGEVNQIPLPEERPQQMEVAPDEEGTAIEIAKKRFPDQVPPEQELLSEEIKQTTAEITIPEEYRIAPQEEAVVAEKFKPNPDGTVRISEDYYGVTRKNGKVVVEGGEATETEALSAKAFYYNPQNKKTGDYPELFGADPSDGFSKFEPEITAYFDRLKASNPEKYADVKRKIEAGNFTQEDQYGVLAEIESNKIETAQRDLRIAQYRASQGEEGYEDYIAQKTAELDGAYQTLTQLHTQFPVVAEKMWEQEVLTKRWKEAEGAGAIMPWLAISGAKTSNMLMGVVNGTGQFLARTAGLYNTADSWSQFWDEGVLSVPETPIIEQDGSINLTNATTEIIPQLAQMYLVFSKGAGGINKVAGVATESNFGLFTAGFLATYKDLYEQAKAANLSDADANLYANIVGMGVAGAELIMPDRNFFMSQKDDYLRFMVQEAAKGTKGGAMKKALTNYMVNISKENLQEFTQDFVSNAGAVIADATVDGANFDEELFSKEGLINTAVVTTMVSGLAGGGNLRQDLTKRRRDIYQLSQNYEQFKEQSKNLVDVGVITPEQAQTLTEEVDRVVAAEGKVPPQMTPNKKAEVVPLVAEKDELEAQKKELDPIFQPPIDKKIQEVEEEILAIYEQKAEMESPTIKPEVVAEQGEEVKVTEEKVVLDETVKTKESVLEGVRDGGNETQVGEEGTQLRPQEKIQAEEVKAEKEVEKVSEKAGISPKNLRELYQVNRDLFGLNKVKSLASAVTMDRMIGAMAKRAGVSKKEMYGRVEFKKGEEAPMGSLKQESKIFKSTAREGLFSIQQKSATPEQWVKMISEKGGKGTSQELEWIGLQDYLNEWMKENNAKSVPKEVVEQYINDNQIEIIEVVKSDDLIPVELNFAKKDFDADDYNATIGSNEEIEYVLEDEEVGYEIIKTDESFYVRDNRGQNIFKDGDYNNEIKSLEDAKNVAGLNLAENNKRSTDDTKYSRYTLEGGQNYREVLLTLTSKNVFDKSKVEIKKNYQSATQGTFDVYYNGELLAGGYDLFSAGTGQYGQKTDSQLNLFAKNLYEKGDKYNKIENKQGNYKSSHWDEANILAHLRLNERTLPNGERVLFIEEVQSDWAQEGKKKGFASDLFKGNFRAFLEQEKGLRLNEEELLAEFNNNQGELKKEFLERTDRTKTPDMPYKKTDQWVGMAMRRVFKMAADEGFNRVAWVTGEQSAERYDLSKQVESVKAQKNYKYGGYVLTVRDKNGNLIVENITYEEDKLSDVVGKELAEKIIKDEGGEYSGLDLEIGGEGMKSFYNSILPKVAKKEAQRFDKKANVEVVDFSDIEIVELEVEEGVKNSGQKFWYASGRVNGNLKTGTSTKSREDAISKLKEKSTGASKQLSIAITPEMRMNLNSAVPLFQGEQGAMLAEDGKYIVYALTNPNVSTPLHELAHVFEHYLTDAERKSVLRWANAKEWNVEVSEKFARGFEKYLADGKSPVPSLQKVFDRFKEWLTDIYQGIKGSDIDVKLNKGMRAIYDQMLGKESEPKPTPEQQARAESFGFNNPYNLIQSIKKQTGKEYTLEEFDNIPDEEIRKAAEGSETVKGKKIKEASKKLADTIRKGKIAKPDIFSAQTPASLVWDAALEAIATTIEAGGTVAQAVSDGLTAIKNSDWYKGLTPDKKAQAEGAFNDWASENVKEVETEKEAPAKAGKMKESGRSKTIRKGNVPSAPQSLVDQLDKSPIEYEQFTVEDAKKKFSDFLGNYGGIKKDNFFEIANDLVRILKENPLDNQWSAFAANVLAAEGVRLADELYKEGDVDGAKKLVDRAMDIQNTVSEIQTKAGQLNGLTAILYYLTPEGMTLYLTRMVERGIVKSNVVKKRRRNAEKSAEVVKKAVEEIQKKAARKVADGVKEGKIAPEVKTKAKGNNPKAYKPNYEKANKLINEGFSLIRKSRGNMTSGGLSPELIEGVAKVIEGYLLKGTTNLKYLYGKVRNAVIDNAEQDITREEFDQIIKDYDLEKVRIEVDKKKLEGDQFLKAKVKEQIKAQDILAELVYEHYSGDGKKIDDIVAAIAEELGLTNDEALNIKQRVDKVFSSVLEEENKALLRRKFKSKRNASTKKTDDAARNISELVMAGALDNKFIADQLSEIYGIPELTPEDVETLKDLSNKFFQAKLYKDEISKKIAEFMIDKLPPDAASIFKGLWYGSILSGAGTQITNILGNLQVLAPEIAAQKLGALFGAKQKGAYMVLPNKQSAKRFAKSIIRANAMMLEVMKNGATYNKYTEENLTKFQAEFSVENIDKLRIGNKYFDKIIGTPTRGVYKPVKYMVRALEAFDQGFGSFAFDAQASIALKKTFTEQGLRGKKLQQALTESLYGTKETVEEAKRLAIEELAELGLDPDDMRKVQKGITDYIRKQLDADVRSDANRFATRVTYKGKPNGMFGVIADFISKVNAHPIVGAASRFVVPFVNVPFNMASIYSDWIPFYGLARAYGVSPSGLLDRINPEKLKSIGVKSPKAVTPQDLRAAWSRTIISSILSSSLIALTFIKYTDDDEEEKPLFEISGTRAYLDFKKRGNVERDMPEMSIRFMGGLPISYKLLPIAPLLVIRGEFMDREKYEEPREYERDFTDRTILAAKTMAAFFVDATPMDGLKKLNESIAEASNKNIDEGEAFYKAFHTWVVKNAVNIAEPNLYRQTLKVYDPTSYSPEDISEILLKSTNLGFLDEDMGFYFDGFGRKTKYYPSEKYFPIQHIIGEKGKDPVDKVMLDKGIYISDYIAPYKTMSFTSTRRGVSWMGSKKFRSEYAEELEELGLLKANPDKLKKAEPLIEKEIGVEFITQKEWQKMCVEVGQKAYKRVQKDLSQIAKMEPEEAKEYIKEIFDEEYADYVDDNFNN